MPKTAAGPVFARLRDAAALLPAIGVFLLMPPAINLFTGTRLVAGVPLIVAYLFGVWLALIACAALLARRLEPPPAAAEPAEAPAPDLPG
ncbi:MAG: hypothetical protein KIT28_12590 [Rubrivivax sp.]|nr:hypothetical protein [Rubrivivax sp.]